MPQIFLVVRQDLAGLRKLVNRVCFSEARFFLNIFICLPTEWVFLIRKHDSHNFTYFQPKPAFQPNVNMEVTDAMLAEHNVINCFLRLSKRYRALEHPRKEYLYAGRCCADY